ncbi:hypothetical protein ACHAXA_011605 [Cyclostephanos tholiformis]|uniref:phosphatidyl-N-methylethanolamine N-methyltransferase n=1 Tax=Cyclostephanos tholiformis TaxID=382380 RepID=A0ABD3SHH7_9STRA
MSFDHLHMPFAFVAFFALGIERLLYSYCFICTDHFKKSVDQNKIPGLSTISKDELYWRSMQRLGMYIKVFQFGVCIYDLLVLDQVNVWNNVFKARMISTPEKSAQFVLGLMLLFIGQVLNYFVFKALGAKGVYYGYEFGYPTARVSCFPYNLNISDPQYWGVLMSIFGIYIAVGASSFMIPIFELIWYLTSMKVLENERGRRWATALAGSSKFV